MTFIAIYGRDFYGRSKYGSNLLIALSVDPFYGEVIGFDTISLNWSEPGGTWSGFRIMYSRAGFPITETDGTLLYDIPIGVGGPTGGEFLHTNLVGGWHYYAIFLYNTESAVWERVAILDALVPFDFKSTDRMWDTLPDYYRQVHDDAAGHNQQTYRINPAIYLNNLDAAPNLQLAKFLHVLGWTFDLLRTQAESVVEGYNITVMHINRVALLAAQFGADIEETAPASANRSLVRNLGLLYRKRGTLDGIREMLSLATGWEIDVTEGPNLMLSEDQANFINPNPPLWDESVTYVTGDRVRYGLHLFQALQTTTGLAEAPPVTRTSNTWWDVDIFVEPLADNTVARADTGDISTWQIEGPDGWETGGTHIGIGAPDPEDGTILSTNALGFKNTTTTDGADFVLRSVARHKDWLTVWSQRLVIESGVPIPRATQAYVAGRYRAGDLVMYQGAPYRALTTTEEDPTDTATWKKLGDDERVRLILSWWAHGPFNGTVSTGGLTQHAVLTEFNETGTIIQETICDAASYANLFYDPFNDEAASFTSGRVAALGTWDSNVGTWTVDRDDEGGFAAPPSSGRSYVLAPPSIADGNVAVTFRVVPTGSRLMGIIFRWSDANNFWIATQTGLYKVVAGAARANPASGALTWASFVNGERLRVTLSGSSISVYKDDVLLGTATDSFNSTATQHGVEVEA